MRKVAVTERALIQRINRALRKRDEVLKRTRGTHALRDLGDYYVVDVRRNAVVAADVNPEAYGRELDVLAPYERVKTGAA